MLDAFLRYRHEHAALLYDAFRTFASNDYRWHARLLALFVLAFLLATPIVVIVVGDDPVGDEVAFAITLAAWPVLVERSGWALRQQGGWPGDDPPQFAVAGFDVLAFLAWSLLAVLAWYLVGFEDEFLRDTGDWSLGIAWGVALAGMLDVSRNAVAFGISVSRGYPLYGPRPRKPGV